MGYSRTSSLCASKMRYCAARASGHAFSYPPTASGAHAPTHMRRGAPPLKEAWRSVEEKERMLRRKARHPFSNNKLFW